ncbi:MAG: DUF1343 domain-containing protein [Chloroflexi bacterium]|nr:DUF1343 domain-containing protein [Chloroflexota bacterium]
MNHRVSRRQLLKGSAALAGLALSAGNAESADARVAFQQSGDGVASSVRPGVDVLLDRKLDLVAGKRIGLVTNPTGVTGKLVSTVDALAGNPNVKLTALFGPEHGVRGAAQAGDHIGDAVDKRTGVTAYSLYGETKRPTAAMLRNVDVLVFDVQDVGTRFYTYIYTLAYVMEAAAQSAKRVIVLDRPNPLSGLAVEGAVLEKGLESFVGLYPIPLRHGMTIGELAELYRGEFGIKCDLTVVTMEGWRRRLWYDETGLPWIPPSPNVPTLDSAVVYPGTGLLEATNLSVGRGTTRPLETLGAPWIEAEAWADDLNGRGLAGVRFRPTYFVPTFDVYRSQNCGGVQVHVLDRLRFRPIEIGLSLIQSARKLYPDKFAWQRGNGFELMAGNNRIRSQVESGAPVVEIARGWDEGLTRFAEARRKYLLY